MTKMSSTLSSSAAPAAFLQQYPLLRAGILKLLAIKDSDIRILTLGQSRDAVDNGLHSGGAFSATIPLVALFYGGFLKLDIEDPTRRGQDIFTLSKGHAVAAMASIYAELGYFDQKLLRHSRSHESLLNGHPGPVLPGVHIATGPMGQGIGVAQGFAIAGRTSPRFDSYVMVGDGELQEGSCWETVMYAGQSHLDNLCVLVDRNNGQLDVHNRTLFPMPELDKVFRSYGWEAHSVDATQYDGVLTALEQFRFGPRNGKPTAIVCNTTKGYGAFSDFMNKHKVTTSESLIVQELALQEERRSARVAEFLEHLSELEGSADGELRATMLREAARSMHLDVERIAALPPVVGPVLTKRVPVRDKQIRYDATALPKLDPKKQYSAAEIVTGAMKVFARDSRVASIDSDLASTSGLEAGVAAVDQHRALNVGVAEANMMLIGEAFAALGCNTWTSTFCPFFNWQVLRRIAVGQQERLEAIAAPDGWLSEGHGLDLTFLATAANFETRTNGATHMGNDDITTFDAVGQLQIIDVSCPQQMLSIMTWIMAGNRGLVYVRVMRTGSAVLYGQQYEFEFGKGQVLLEGENDTVALISSGRGVHEALEAAKLSATAGVGVTVVDMPSIDDELLLKLYHSGKILLFAEQNNGYIWQNFLKVLYRNRATVSGSLERVLTVNTLTAEGKPQFIHSATYEELVEAFKLAPVHIAKTIMDAVAASKR
ncbi:transketolase [Granulicella sp. WH15]|uniref:transketolase C-terminal domain-containing protein n=1 Tax=Granulicella sp. WH15 TaxID=2602070 RepID=UPI0013679276|nr:transketolase C-terminal domain-containing protein [Granulicella sp. WH15]QHN04211.1 transketolase [Granulicella sp. WH15]